MLNFYDFEVFKEDWLVVIINPLEHNEKVIVNSREELEEYYESHKNQIWVGYNSREYDSYILKGILCDFEPKEINDFIIKYGNRGYMFSSLFRQIKLNDYDVMSGARVGLKTLEGFMGNDMRETSVPFDIDRKLTDEEIQDTIKYCKHDVKQTMEVFLNRKGDFDTHMNIIKVFNLPMSYISKTQAQLIGSILGASRRNYDDEFDIKIPNTLRLNKYKEVLEWYLDLQNRRYKDDKGKKVQLDIMVADCPHVFAWGGVHGALNKYNGEGVYLMADVASLYPSLMIVYNYFSRSIKNPQKYIDIYKTNLEMKKTNHKDRPVYKLICNTTYGCMKDKSNPLYDPQMANNICIAGQLLLLDLIEKLEPHIERLIQSNTDGILLKLKSMNDFNIIDDIVYEWEARTGLQMEFDLYRKVFQKDVNNYVILPYEKDKKVKKKGAYTKDLSDLDYDLPIVNEALVNYMVNDVSIEDTVYSCRDYRKFQKIVKVSNKYICGFHNGERLKDKTFRVFASKRKNDDIIGKVKLKNHVEVIEKFANTPLHCFIDNSEVKNKKPPRYLDKDWYIDLAIERLRQYGIDY